MTLRRSVGCTKARFRSPSIAYVCGFCGGDRNRIGVRYGGPFDLVRLLDCCSFCLTLSSFTRIVALIRAGKNERIRKRVDGDGDVLLLLLLLLPLSRGFLSRVRMSKRFVHLVVRGRGDMWNILLLPRCVGEYDLDTTPARFGGSLRFLRVHVRIRIPATSGLRARGFTLDSVVILLHSKPGGGPCGMSAFAVGAACQATGVSKNMGKWNRGPQSEHWWQSR